MSVHYANISGLYNNYDSCIVDVGYKSRHWNLVMYLQGSYRPLSGCLQGGFHIGGQTKKGRSDSFKPV